MTEIMNTIKDANSYFWYHNIISMINSLNNLHYLLYSKNAVKKSTVIKSLENKSNDFLIITYLNLLLEFNNLSENLIDKDQLNRRSAI